MASNAAESVSSTYYFRSIDGLRLFAAVNIILFHFERIGGLHALHGSPGWLFMLVKGPAFHASLFFILSGFIYTIKYAAHTETFSATRFLKSRFAALYPLHVITTISMVPFTIMAISKSGGTGYGKLVVSCLVHLGLIWPFFPFGTYEFNSPSWALAAFFFCYLLFYPALKRVVRLTRRREVFAALALCLCVPALWSCVFGLTEYSDEIYFFFHVFPPVRFCEFAVGMLLARLYQVSTFKTGGTSVWNKPPVNDLLNVLVLVLVYQNLSIHALHSALLTWVSYHMFMIPLYAMLLYRFARGGGLLPGLTMIPVVRQMGQCSFYPYLLHIPLVSWFCWLLERGFGYSTFLHAPQNVLLFIAALYGLSTAYWVIRGRRRRRKRTMAGIAPAGKLTDDNAGKAG